MLDVEERGHLSTVFFLGFALGRVAKVVRGSSVGPGPHEDADCLQTRGPAHGGRDGEREGCPAFLVVGFKICTPINELLHHLDVTLFSGLQQEHPAEVFLLDVVAPREACLDADCIAPL